MSQMRKQRSFAGGLANGPNRCDAVRWKYFPRHESRMPNDCPGARSKYIWRRMRPEHSDRRSAIRAEDRCRPGSPRDCRWRGDRRRLDSGCRAFARRSGPRPRARITDRAQARASWSAPPPASWSVGRPQTSRPRRKRPQAQRRNHPARKYPRPGRRVCRGSKGPIGAQEAAPPHNTKGPAG